MPFDYNQFAAKKPQENANGVQPVDHSSNLDNVFAEAEAELQKTNNSDTQVPHIDAPDKDGYQLMQDGFREQELKLASGFNYLNRAAASVPEGITRAASVITNPVAKLFGIPEYEPNTLSKTIGLDKVDNYLVSERDKYQKEIKQINPYTELGVVNAIKENNYEAAFRNLAGGVLESLPASVALMTLPIAGVGVPGQIGFSTALFGSGKLKELDEVAPDLPEEAKVINATVNGALEGIFETLFGSGAIGSSLDNILKKEGLKQGEKIIGNGVRQVFSNLLTKYPALSPFGEMYEEMATQVTQNITDKLTGVDPEKPVTEGMWDAGILGFTSGGLHSGMIAGTKAIANRLNKHIEKKQARANIEANLSPITNAKTGNVHAVKLRGQEKAEDEVYFVVDVDDDGFANIVDRQGNKVLDSEGKPYQNIEDFTTENVISREQILQGELQSLTQEQAAKEQTEAQTEREKNELAQIPEQLTIPNENGKEQKYVFAGEVRRNNPEKPNEITDFEVGLVDEFGEMPYDIAFLPAKTVYDYIGTQNESNEKELDQVLADAEKEVSAENSDQNGQNVTTTPSEYSNLSGKPVVTQKIGNADIDVIENEDHDEIVPSEKLPLEKALPLLEKKFKDNPKFEVVAEKERVEIPGRVIKGETKWDEDVVEPSTFKTVIKSVKIYPKEVLNQRRKEEQESKSFYQEQKKSILVDAVSEFNSTPESRSDKQKASEIESLATKLGYMTDRSPMNEIRIFNNKEGYVNIPKTSQPEQSGQINQLQTNENISNPDKLTTFKAEQQVNTSETTQPKATKPPTPKQIERAKLLKSEPNSAREVILKYFLSGGKVSPEMINRESIGRDRTGKLRSEGERRSMFWVTKQGEANYTDQLEHILHGTPWENMLDDPTDFSNEVLDVLSLGTPSNMMAELKRLQSEQGSFDQQYSPEQVSEIETWAAQQAESERLDYEEQLQSVFEELFENQNISEQEIVNLFYTNNEENDNDQNEGRSGQASQENSTTTRDNPIGSIKTSRGSNEGEERQDAEVKSDLSLKQKKQLVISRYGGMYEDVANATPEEIYNTIPEVDYAEAKQIHAEVKAEFNTASKPKFDYHEERYEDQRNVNPEEYGHRLLSREERNELPVWQNGKMIAGPDYRIDDFEIGDTVINNYNGQALKIDRIEKNKKGEPISFVLVDIKSGTEYKESVGNGRGIYQDLQIKETNEPSKIEDTSTISQIEELLNQYNDSGEIESIDDLVSEIENLEDIPSEIIDAIDEFNSDKEEDFKVYGGRGDAEVREDKFISVLENYISKNNTSEKSTEIKPEKPVNQNNNNISESESSPKNETIVNQNGDFFTEIQQNIPTNDKIKLLEDKLARQKKLREQKVKNMNERNGVFGDAQADPRQIDLFAETFAPTQENFQAAIDKVDAEINSIQKEIDQERKVLLTAARENKGQLEIKAEQKSEDSSLQKQNTSKEDAKNTAKKEIVKAESEVDTNPTEAQKEAGNYKMGHVNIQGFDITIENPKGSVRSGVDKTGKPWSVTMNNTYGYFKRTVGKDGDHVDVFLGDKPLSDKVFVIDQNNEDGNFDESKVMLGFDSAEQAQSDYMKNYSPGWKGFGAMTESSIDDFKEWLNDGARQNKAYSEYKQNQSVEANEKVEVKPFEKLKSKMDKLQNNNYPEWREKVNEYLKKRFNDLINVESLLPEASFISNIYDQLPSDINQALNDINEAIKLEKKQPEATRQIEHITDLEKIRDIIISELPIPQKGDKIKFTLGNREYTLPSGDYTILPNGRVQFDLFGQKILSRDQYEIVGEVKTERTFPKDRVVSAYSHLHMSPYNTAKVEEETWNKSAEELKSTIQKYVPELTEQELTHIIDKFKQDYLNARESVWRAASISYSSAVAGSSNFNLRQANQRGNALDRREEEFSAWLKKEVSNIESSTGVTKAKSIEREKANDKKVEAKRLLKNATVKQWMNLKVGDQLDIGNSSGNPVITKKNKFSVETGPGAKWTLKEVYGIDHSEAQQIMDEIEAKVKPEVNPIPKTDIPTSFDVKSFYEFESRLDKGEVNIDEFKQAYETLKNSKNGIISELNSMTKDALLSKMSMFGKARYKSEKKDRVVNALYDDMLMSFSFGMTSYGFGETIENAIDKKVAKVTQEDIDKHVEEYKKRIEDYKQRVATYKNALTNPQTLEEFKIFIKENGIDKLNPDQKAVYDGLITDKVIDSRQQQTEKKAEIAKVELGDTKMEITETKHTKTGANLFVVQLSDRVERSVYDDLNTKAKKLGGYYSSYRVGGAVPGFQFKDRAQAEKFISLQNENVSNIDKIEERKEEKLKDKTEKLRNNANSIIERVDAELGRERLTNTAKRAGQAASTEARLNEEKRIAQTMLNIADAIDNGDVKLLDGIKAKTHIELLDNAVATAKSNEMQVKYPSYQERLSHQGEPATLETLEYVKDTFFPRLYVDRIRELVKSSLDTPGVKLIAARFQKKISRLGEHDYFQVRSDEEVGEIMDMVKANPRDKWRMMSIENAIANYNRLKTMGIENDSMLRAALREYIQYRGKRQEVDKVKELERKLAGRGRNVGFDYFPTPKATAELMVDEADISEGMDVLEPSAGNGNIADAIKEAGITPDVVEISSELSNILEAKGYDVVASDFMGYNGKLYDRIIMNPPFSNGMDGEHVQHAYDLLKPGGRIVAIVGEGTFSRSDKKATAFREWLESVNGTEESLPSGTFSDKTLYSTTMANARMVVIDKEDSTDNEPRFRTSDKLPETININGVELYKDIASRLNTKKLTEYLVDNNFTNEEIQNVLNGNDNYWIDQFLGDEYGISINSDNYIQFNELTPEVKKIIGNNKVLVYHHTSTGVIDDIRKNGLIQTEKDVNRNGYKSLGVYVTSEYSGNAVEGYKNRAWNFHGGDPITLEIATTVNKLKPDANDDDIKSGRYQFILEKVNPKDILNLPKSNTILVNGTPRPTTNSKGQPITDSEEKIRNFWKWFGDSKVVDSEGRPLVVYHGSNRDFNEFKGGKLGVRSDTSKGFYFSPYEQVGKNFSGQTNNIKAVYLSISNPRIAKSYIEIGTINSEYVYKSENKGFDGAYFIPSKEEIANKNTGLSEYNEEWVAFSPTQIKSATDNIGTFDGTNTDIRFRKTSPIGFYSTVESALEQIKQGKGTTEQFKAMLLKNGAKQAEFDGMALSGISWDEYFVGNRNDIDPNQTLVGVNIKGTITKADIQNWIDQNKIEVKEVVKGVSKTLTREQALKALDQGKQVYGIDDEGVEGLIETLDDLDSFERWALSEDLAPSETKYQSYQEPGGSNYKELLLTMPGEKNKFAITEKNGKWAVYNVKTEQYEGGFTSKEVAEERMQQFNSNPSYAYNYDKHNFKSSHFDEPNILAHIRFNEREVNGERVLFIEEIQSDWAQKGKKEGFKNNPELIKAQKEYGEIWKQLYDGETGTYKESLSKDEIGTLKSQLNNASANIDKQKGANIPNMPFQKTDQWVNLSLRRMMRYAAENGFDRIAWTNGEQQAARYDLSKQVDDIWTSEYNDSWNGKQYEKLKDVEVTLKGDDVKKLTINESGIVVNGDFIGESLDNIVGKEMAEKIINAKEDTNFGEQDLKIGGSGMKAFYDAIVPSAANKLGKPFGARVENIQIDVKPDVTDEGIDLESGEVGTAPEGKYAEVQSIPVTDKMIESVSQGIPLFRNEYDTPLEAAERIVKAMNQRSKMVNGVADRLSNELNTPIIVVRNETMLPLNLQRQVKKQGAKRSVMGVFNPTDGKIYLVSNNIPSELETEKTILHEIVGHKGLRGLLGAKAHRNLMEMVWNSLTPAQKADLKNRLGNLDPLVLADEYMAELAEQNSTPKWYEKILAKLREMLRKVFPNLRLNNAELKTIIRKSYEALKRPAPEQFDNPLDFAEALAKFQQNNKNQSMLTEKEFYSESNPDIRFRIQPKYNETVIKSANKIRNLLDKEQSNYFSVEDSKGDTVKIRVSDHSANKQNNGDEKTLSFVTERSKQRRSAFNQMVNEWAIQDNGLTDTYEEIEDILSSELGFDDIRFRINKASEGINTNPTNAQKEEGSDLDIENKSIDKKKQRIQDKIEQTPNESETHKKRTILKQKIKDLESGWKSGEVDTKAMIWKVQTDVIEYAKKNMPFDKAGKSEINSLLRLVRYANNPKHLETVLEKIDTIVSGLDVKLKLNNIDKILHDNIAKNVNGKPQGTLDPEVYLMLDKIRAIRKLKGEDEIDQYVDSLNDDDIEGTTLFSVFGNLEEKSRDEINDALDKLISIVSTGKVWYHDQLQKRKKINDGLRGMVLDKVSGGQGLVSELDLISSNSQVKTGAIGRFINAHINFEWLLDKISKDKSEETGKGKMQEYFGDVVTKATNDESKGIREQTDFIHKKATEIFGVDGSKLAKKFHDNTKVIKKSGVTYINREGKRVEIPLSQNQAYKKWMEWQDQSLSKTFKTMGWDETTRKELDKFIFPDVKEWAEWQLKEYYPGYYEGINQKYNEAYFANLGRNENYSPIRREVVSPSNVEDAMMQKPNVLASVGNQSLKTRKSNINNLLLVDGDSMLAQHIAQMEHFKAWVMPINQLRSVFSSREVQKAIKNNHGVSVLSNLNNQIADMARGGEDRANIIDIVDKIRRNFVTAELGANISLFPKQSVSLLAYLSEVPVKNYVTGMLDLALHLRKAIGIIKSNEMVTERFQKGWAPEIRAAMKQDTPGALSQSRNILGNLRNILLFPTKMGDYTAVLGGWVVYKYHYDNQITKGKNEQEAHEYALNQVDRSVSRTQQSGALKDVSQIQKGSWNKVLTMFKSSPIQQFRYENAAFRNLINGRGSVAQNAKIIALYHIVIPVMFQLISNLFTDDDDEKERNRLLRAGVLGSFNSLMVVGDIVESVLEKIMGESWGDYSATPLEGSVTKGLQGVGNISSGVKDLDKDKILKGVDQLIYGINNIGIGLPYRPVKKLIKQGDDILHPENVKLRKAEEEYKKIKKEVDDWTKARNKAKNEKDFATYRKLSHDDYMFKKYTSIYGMEDFVYGSEDKKRNLKKMYSQDKISEAEYIKKLTAIYESELKTK